MYQPLEIELCEMAGLVPSLIAMRLPKGSSSDSQFLGEHLIIGPNDAKLAGRLIKAGNDHGKFARGITVWLELTCQAGWLLQYVTYRIGVDNLSSSSAMHGELKNLTGIELAEQKQQDLGEKVYTRIEKLNYQSLRSIYRARHNHRHPDWRIFCQFIETLPYFDKLIMPGFGVKE